MAENPRSSPELIGKYRLISMLGHGAMGEVWLAEDTVLKRKVALKLLPTWVTMNEAMVKRFLTEARAAAQLNHPNVVTIYETVCDGSLVYTAMELVDGLSLADRVRKGGPVSWREASRYVRDAARGLDAAHRARIVHRDVKPSNIMLSKDGIIKVVDFGLARLQEESSHLTRDGAVVGTPDYMSPEQCRGEQVDHRSDIYSLACTYFCLLAGRPPFLGTTPAAVILGHLQKPLPDIREIVPALPHAVLQIVERGAQKDPGLRFPSAGELAARLNGVLRNPLPAPAPARAARGVVSGAGDESRGPRVQIGAAPRREAGTAPPLFSFLGGGRAVLGKIVLGVGLAALVAGLALTAPQGLLHYWRSRGEPTDAPKAPPAAAVAPTAAPGATPAAAHPAATEAAPAPEPRKVEAQPPAGDMTLIPAGMLRPGIWDSSRTIRLLQKYKKQFLGQGGLAVAQRNIETLFRFVNFPERVADVRPFDMDLYETTNAEYREFLAALGGRNDPGICHADEGEGKDHTPATWTDPAARAIGFEKDDLPVTGVDWFDAYAYARWRGKRLPTRDEWEWAARGPGALPYPWGQEFDRSRYWPPDGKAKALPAPARAFTSPRPGAPCGMSGNAAEWTLTPADATSVYLMGGDYTDVKAPDLTALAFHGITFKRTDREPYVGGIRCAKDAAGEPSPGMVRIAGGRARLGGETSQAIELIRKFEALGILVCDLLGDFPEPVQVPAFRLDRLEVSNGEYRLFLESLRKTGSHEKCHPEEPKGKDHTPQWWSEPKLNGDELPVVGVDWFDAYAYAAWAGKRLPTDREWERAARGDTTHFYPWGDAFDPARCICGEGGASGPVPAASAPAGVDVSPFGVLHMAGNVMEWTSSIPEGDDDMDLRNIRGGAWGLRCELYGAIFAHPNKQEIPTRYSRKGRGPFVGFRCAADAAEEARARAGAAE